MKYLIIFLGYLSLSEAFFFNFWRRPTVEPVTEKITIPIATNEHYTPEELILYNRLYSSNGYGYYPQLNYPTVYTHLPIQQDASPLITYLNSQPIVLGDKRQPIVVPEIPHLAEEIKIPETSVHLNTEYATPVHLNTEYVTPVHLNSEYATPEKEIINEELPLPALPQNFNNGAYLTETIPSNEFHQIDGAPGQYSHSYVLSDGTKVFEEGHLKKSITGNDVIVKSGHYEYVNDGEVNKVNWIADEDGFRVIE